MPGHPRTVAATACAVALLSACSTAGSPGPTRTVTVTPSSHAPSHTSSGSAGATPSPTGSPAATALPGTCDTMLPSPAVANALGRPVNGQTAFVVGVAEPDIGRVATVNCRYGLPDAPTANAVPVVEIGVSLYDTVDDAAKRIPATVDDYVAHGATKTGTTVAGTPATILTGGTGTGYTAATIVLAAGQRTVVAGIVETPAGADPTKDLVALATLAVTNSGA